MPSTEAGCIGTRRTEVCSRMRRIMASRSSYQVCPLGCYTYAGTSASTDVCASPLGCYAYAGVCPSTLLLRVSTGHRYGPAASTDMRVWC
eukprot:1935841-Rhodomonas_salina.1